MRRKGETEEERGKDQIGKRKAENEFELWSEEINIYTFGVNYLLNIHGKARPSLLTLLQNSWSHTAGQSYYFPSEQFQTILTS